MLRSGILALLVVGALVTEASAVILLYLDDVDDMRIVNAAANAEKVKVSCKELLELGNQFLKLKKPDLESLLGKSAEKPAKTYAMPLGEMSGLHFNVSPDGSHPIELSPSVDDRLRKEDVSRFQKRSTCPRSHFFHQSPPMSPSPQMTD